ncbi:MAG: hypothetical protein Q8Q65_01450, partial [bacterium]|nr:hypothetical protein [bacterium]
KEATISAKGFVVFEVSKRLNKESDEVSLVFNSETVDVCGYSEYYGDNISIGRSPDGESDCRELSEVSRGSNNSPAVPTATLVPTKTPTPTNVPPTPTRTPTPVPDASPTPTSTPAPIPTNTPVPKKSRILDLFLPTASPEAQIEGVLGEATSSAEGLDLDLGGVFMSLGGLFVVGAGAYVVRKENNK